MEKINHNYNDQQKTGFLHSKWIYTKCPDEPVWDAASSPWVLPPVLRRPDRPSPPRPTSSWACRGQSWAVLARTCSKTHSTNTVDNVSKLKQLYNCCNCPVAMTTKMWLSSCFKCSQQLSQLSSTTTSRTEIINSSSKKQDQKEIATTSCNNLQVCQTKC